MLFFDIEETEKYVILTRKKFTLQLSFVPLITYFVLLPILNFLIKGDFFVIAGGLLLFLCYVFGMWMALEGIITNRKISKYKKEGKKIEHETKKELGISSVKIYK